MAAIERLQVTGPALISLWKMCSFVNPVNAEFKDTQDLKGIQHNNSSEVRWSGSYSLDACTWFIESLSVRMRCDQHSFHLSWWKTGKKTALQTHLQQAKKVKSQEHFFQSGLHSKKISLSLDGWSQELYQGTIRNSSLDVRLKGLPFTFPCAEIR